MITLFLWLLVLLPVLPSILTNLPTKLESLEMDLEKIGGTLKESFPLRRTVPGPIKISNLIGRIFDSRLSLPVKFDILIGPLLSKLLLLNCELSAWLSVPPSIALQPPKRLFVTILTLFSPMFKYVRCDINDFVVRIVINLAHDYSHTVLFISVKYILSGISIYYHRW